MGSMAANDWDRLAESVRERRVELGLTQEDARAAGGPSTATMRLIEGALQHSYQPSTLRDLEHVLQWERGSVRKILAGGDPVPLADIPRIIRRDVEFRGTGSAADLEPYVTEVRQEAYEALAGLFGEDAPHPDDPDAEAAMSALPGRAVFPGGGHQAVAEAATWDKAPYSFGERVKIIAIGRQLRARADERENRRTGLSHYPVTGAGIALISVAGRAVRASS